MAEKATKGRRLDILLYSAALVAAGVGALMAIFGGTQEPSASVVHSASVPSPAGSEAREAQMPNGRPAPVLPAVPDLANEPPSAPPDRPDAPEMATLSAEMRMLSRAQPLIAGSPNQAIQMLEQHRAQYPSGVLAEEREALLIEALISAERRDEAERRYYDFRDAFPRSEFSSRLQALMRRSGSNLPQ